MNINGKDIQNIGSIRAKPVRDQYQLTIAPPPGGLVSDLAILVEIDDVPLAEVERIARVAPHLLQWPPRPRQPSPGQRKSRRSAAPIVSPKGHT